MKTVTEIKKLVIQVIEKQEGEYKGIHGTKLFELDMDEVAMHIDTFEEREEVLKANIEEKLEEIEELKESIEDKDAKYDSKS